MHERQRQHTLCLYCRRESRARYQQGQDEGKGGLGAILLASMAASITADRKSSSTTLNGAKHFQYSLNGKDEQIIILHLMAAAHRVRKSLQLEQHLSSNRCGNDRLEPMPSSKYSELVTADRYSLYLASVYEELDGTPRR